MRSSHRIVTLHFGIALFLSLALIILGMSTSTNAQQPASSPSEERDRGIQLYKQGDTAKAIKILTKVVKKHSDDADAWYYLGLAFNKDGAIGAARPAFERLVILRPDSSDAHAKLAYALILANEPEKAIAIGKRAIELGDRSPEPHYAIAEASLRTGELDKAVEEAEVVLRIDPAFSLALITQSLANYSLKRYSDAEMSLEKFLARAPNDFDADT